MIQAFHAKQINHAAVYAGLGITRTVNDAADSRMHDGARTHGAGLQRDEQLATRQTVVAKHPRCVAQGGNFGMGRRIALANRRIEPTSDNGSVEDHDGGNRHLPATLGSARQLVNNPLQHLIYETN